MQHQQQQPRKLQQYRSTSPPPPSLDNIVTSYLREQHAKCSNPVATCPPFSLFRWVVTFFEIYLFFKLVLSNLLIRYSTHSNFVEKVTHATH